LAFDRTGMRIVALSGLLLAVAACGVDGPPKRPEKEPAPEPGVTISGSAEFGVTGGSGR